VLRGFDHPRESGRSAAWLARLPWEQEAVGSNPAAPTVLDGLKTLDLSAFLPAFLATLKKAGECHYTPNSVPWKAIRCPFSALFGALTIFLALD
jgi:hypothetical protein